MHDLTAGHSRDDARRLALRHRALDDLINPDERSAVVIDVIHAARL
jgi:hypothetical protein